MAAVFSEACDFGSFDHLIVLRLETIDADFKRLLRHLQLGDAAERMAEQVLAKPRPSQPLDGVDRQLKLLHYYLTDDGHDLGEVVRQRYRARGTKMPELHDHGAPYQKKRGHWEW